MFSQVLTVFENPILSCRTLCPSAAVAGLSLVSCSHGISLMDKRHSLPSSTCLRWSCAKTLVSGMLWKPAQCPGSESCNDCGSNAGELSFEAGSRLMAVFLQKHWEDEENPRYRQICDACFKHFEFYHSFRVGINWKPSSPHPWTWWMGKPLQSVYPCHFLWFPNIQFLFTCDC